nr:protein-tyrosine-phosphatase ptp1 [Quercus suber]
MVMQYRCPVVVMLTRLVHNYRVLHCVEFKMVKCGDYFQAGDGPREFGNTHIVTKWIKTTDTSIVLRHLELEEEPMSVLHIQYLEWLDHRVPKDTIAVHEILKRIYLVPPNLGPVVVHCAVQVLGEQEHIAQFITQFKES